MFKKILPMVGHGVKDAGRDFSITRFVILAVPRVGSNYLCGMLNSHPEILCHHELFHPNDIYYAFGHRNGDLDFGTLQDRDHLPKEFLIRVWEENLGCAAVGFKLLSGQNRTAFELVLGDTGIKKILLTRRNRIKTYVSLLRAQRTGVYSNADKDQRRKDIKVTVDIDSVYENIERNKRYYEWIHKELNASRQIFLEVAYENLTKDEEKLRILEFIGVSLYPAYLQPVNKKQSSGDLRDSVTNFAELAIRLRGTDLEAELYSLD